MRHIVTVFIYELRRNLRRRGFLFMTFGIPVIAFVLLHGYAIITDLNLSNSQSVESGGQTPAEQPSIDIGGITAAGYVDLSGEFANPDFVLDHLIPYADEAAAKQALAAGEIDVYYVISADYLETGQVTLVSPSLALNKFNDNLIEDLFFQMLGKGISPEEQQRLRNPANFAEIHLQREGVVQDVGANYAIVYIFSIAFLLSVFLTNGYLMQTVIEEKETRLIEILISTVRPTQLLIGKILALGLLGLLQIVAWVVAMYLLVQDAGSLNVGINTDILNTIANITIPAEMLPAFLAYFLLGYLFFAAAYGVVGAISSSMQEGPQYAVIFTLPAAIPYYFFALFVEAPDAPLPVALSMFPLTAPLSMIMRLVVFDVPLWQVLVSLGLLALSTVGMMWLAGRLFRVQTLLSGTTPKLRDIPRLIRG